MIDTNTNQNTEQQPTTPTPEASGDPGGERTFTQEEVNRIVSERLARDRADRAKPSPEDTREADLKARESKLTCREYISAEGYPAELLELFDTSDSEKFKAAVEKLDSLVDLPSKHRKPAPRFITGGGGGHGAPRSSADMLLEQAFAPPKI